ncbi:hypothetical protein [Shewanella sp.]|uniref:hypothetical protein n=1 Tax=Shewanella sp. TaxID=50422 RepID=UPI0035676331
MENNGYPAGPINAPTKAQRFTGIPWENAISPKYQAEPILISRISNTNIYHLNHYPGASCTSSVSNQPLSLSESANEIEHYSGNTFPRGKKKRHIIAAFSR